MDLVFTPGTVVRLRTRPEWGLGRVQSAAGERITVDFDEAGKVTLDRRHAALELVAPAKPPAGQG